MPPTYETPSCPLSADAAHNIGKVAQKSQQSVYKTQIKEALKGLADAIYDAQARLRDRQASLQHLQKQHKDGNKEKTERLEKLEQHVAALEEEVDDLTAQAEELVRSCIDQHFAVEDESKIISELHTSAMDATRARTAADDDANQLPAESLVNKALDLREGKATAWQAESNYHRYAKNNEYINFKRLWHDGAVGDSGSVLPNADKWFRADGTPVMEVNRAGGDGEDDSDQDVAIARENISLRCPLSMLPLAEPFTNRHCQHTFEKKSIMEYLQSSRGQVICPTTGCDQTMSWPRFNDDFELDQVILRRIQRAKRDEEQNMNVDTDEDEEEEEEEEQSVVVGASRSRRVKNER